MTEQATTAADFGAATGEASAVRADLLFVPVFQDSDTFDDLPNLDAATGGEISRARASGEFRGKAYEFFLTPIVDRAWGVRRVGLVGAGKRAEWDVERLRRVAAACSYTAQLRSVERIAFLLRGPGDPVAAAKTVADGLCAAEFDAGTHKSTAEPAGQFPRHVLVVARSAPTEQMADAVRRGRIIGTCVNAARDLANEPGNLLTPRTFAARIAALAPAGVTAEILDEARLRTLDMGLLLGVAQGSAEPPRLVVLRYEPPDAPKTPVVALVGKGITFDSGGISIKPAEGMDRMKDDMSGGAAVAAAVRALALLGAPVRVLGVIPASENMPSGTALRPGDVIRGASGKTVEITNTDAEGRLILGDALWYAQQLGGTHLIDVATLTGACMVALGKNVSGVFGSSEAWVEAIQTAARIAGERVWPLPIDGDFPEMLRSDIADLINAAGRPAGAITAACFLREFVDDRPWAHLDIAGTAWADDRKAYQAKGATGVAVRTLIELAQLAGAAAPPPRD